MTKERTEAPDDYVAEIVDVDLGDARLDKRCLALVSSVAAEPSAAFPQSIETNAGLEAAYRFFNNERVTPQDLLEPHYRRTVARAAATPDVLVVHDSSDIWYRGEDGARAGLGYLKHGQRGYMAHFALVVSRAPGNEPLGVVGVTPLVFGVPVKGLSRTEKERLYKEIPESRRKSARWPNLIRTASTRLAGHRSVIHVCDCEADDLKNLSKYRKEKTRFVIRAYHNRHVVGGRLRTVLSETKGEFLREVQVTKQRGRRRGRQGRRQPTRTARTAKLHARGGQISIVAGASTGKLKGQTVQMNLVQVYEVDAPEDQVPIAWDLLTTEPIDTPEQLEAVVDMYRARWTIEEYFKALKTGCSLEKRQLTTLEGLLNVLALLIPIAWRMLLLRTQARAAPNAPCVVLEPDEVTALRVFSKRVTLPKTPTNEQTLLALAGLGGHLKRNGAPGWLTIARGWTKFMLLYEGWAARTRCDQS